ncbi:MAG: 50S ribosomal protein L11 methyltransferase [Muribaculaceae bacterium]|nr:50S ribosomal protein L11 methyltransferase [Muribaculaceae bacterium]
MNDYYSVRVNATPCSSDITDLAASFLADAGFESFEPDDKGLTAYVSVAAVDALKLARTALEDFPMEAHFNISCHLVKGENWNEEWEKHYFKPILIDEECVIHSSFHTDVPQAPYDIVIDPKMAFGTGHHDTTSNMVRLLLESDLEGRKVIDMGTGTGILGILAAMRGASDVTGIEIDLPAFENAVENISLNGVDMTAVHGDASALDQLQEADFLLANINRNIILNDIDRYAKKVKKGGKMFLSGFYEEDVPLLLEAACVLGFKEEKRLVTPARWTALSLVKKND